MRLADENHLRFGRHAHQLPKCPQRLRNPLIRLQKSENSDQWRIVDNPKPLTVPEAITLRQPRAMRDSRDRSSETIFLGGIRDTTAVDDDAAGAFQYPPEHRDALIIGPFLPRNDVLAGIRKRLCAA